MGLNIEVSWQWYVCVFINFSIFHQPDLITQNEVVEVRPTILKGFCYEPGYWLYVFDANGDRYVDMTCHSSTGHLQIAEGHIYYDESKYHLQIAEGHIYYDESKYHLQIAEGHIYYHESK